MPKKPKRRRVDMDTLPPIPDTFENVVKAVVQPVKPPEKKEAEKERGRD